MSINTVFRLLTSWCLSTCRHYFTTLGEPRKAAMRDRVNACQDQAEWINPKFYYYRECNIKSNKSQHWGVCLKFSRLLLTEGRWGRTGHLAHCVHLSIQRIPALFALNANEEKASGVSLHVINIILCLPRFQVPPYNLNLSKKKASCIFTTRVVHIPSERLKDIYTKNLQYRKFMVDVMAEGFWPEIQTGEELQTQVIGAHPVTILVLYLTVHLLSFQRRTSDTL